MKTVIVAGFFSRVRDHLRENYSAQISSRSLVLVPQIASGEADVNKFKWNLFDRLGSGASEILVLVAILRGKEYILEIIESLIQEAYTRKPSATIALKIFKDVVDVEGVKNEIKNFGLEEIQRPIPPDNLRELEAWIASELSGRILLHPRARRGARKSQFENPTLIFHALNLLAAEYREVRLNGSDGQRGERLTTRLGELELELTASISSSRAGEEGDAYYVFYPCGQLDKKEFLSHHLKKGSDHDERTCLRIYFFWDAENGLVVVGWLSSHLGTRNS